MAKSVGYSRAKRENPTMCTGEKGQLEDSWSREHFTQG